MHYEINIALNGKHLFATHKRSITCSAELEQVFRILNEKFPESEGYSLSVSYYPGRGYGSSREGVKAAIEQGNLSRHFSS